MFGPLADDRHSLLLVVGVALAAAYVAGGAAVTHGLQQAIVEQADRFEEGPRLAFVGGDPFASAPLAPVEGSREVAMARVVDGTGHARTVAAIEGVRGLGQGVTDANVSFPGGTSVAGRVDEATLPRGWVFATAEELRNESATFGHALLLRPGAAAPIGATVVPLAGLPDFVLAGGEDVTAAFTLLVAVTAFVVVLVASAIAARGVEAHAADIRLLSSLGATTGRIRGLVAAWLAKVVLFGVLLGAAIGITSAYAVFTLGNRVGLRAPVVPAPEPVVLTVSLGILALAAIAAGALSGGRLVGRASGPRRTPRPARWRGRGALTVAGVVLATALFVGVQSIAAAALDPRGFYAEGAEPVLPAGGSPAPGRGSLPEDVVRTLQAAPFVTTALPQAFLYTVVRGEPVVVRGADLDALVALHDARFEGDLPARGSTDAAVGERLAARLGIATGDVLLLPGSSKPDLEASRVVALVRGSTGLRDEVLVDLALGTRLAGHAPGEVSFVEVVASDDDALQAWLAETRDAGKLSIRGPAAARIGGNATLAVLHPDGSHAGDATLRGPDGREIVANATGRALVPVLPGRARWVATAPGFSEAHHDLVGAGPNETLVPIALRTIPAIPAPSGRFEVEVEAVNLADRAASAELPVAIDGAVRAHVDATAPARGVARSTVALDGLSAGEHEIRVGTVALTILVAPPDEAKAQWRLVPATSTDLRTVSMRDALDDVFGSVALAGALIHGLAFLLFFGGNLALFSRLIHERAPDLLLLRALGATRGAVVAFGLRALGPVAALAAVAGTAAGIGVAELYVRLDLVTLFGHTLVLEWTPALVATLGGVALASTLAPVVVGAWLTTAERPSTRIARPSARSEAPA